MGSDALLIRASNSVPTVSISVVTSLGSAIRSSRLPFYDVYLIAHLSTCPQACLFVTICVVEYPVAPNFSAFQHAFWRQCGRSLKPPSISDCKWTSTPGMLDMLTTVAYGELYRCLGPINTCSPQYILVLKPTWKELKAPTETAHEDIILTSGACQ